MSYDATRLLLDSLMGVNRNGDKADQIITDFKDSKVCKDFLTGLCLHDLFTNTKADKGACAKSHDLDIQKR